MKKKSSIMFVLSFIKENKPSLFVCYIIMILFTGLNTALNTLMIKYIMDSIAYGNEIKAVIIFLGLLVLYYTMQIVYGTWFKYHYMPKVNNMIKVNMNKKVFEKIIQTDIQKFEETDFYNVYARAVTEADARIMSVLDCLYNLMASFVSIISIVAVMVALDWWMILISLTSLILTVIFSTKMNLPVFQADQDRLPHHRKMEYIKKVISSQQYCKEIKLYPISSLLMVKYDDEKREIDKNFERLGKKVSGLSFFADFASLVTDPAIMLYLALRIWSGKLLIGDFSALLMASSNFRNLTGTILSYIPRLDEEKRYIAQLQNFLDSDSEIETFDAGMKVEPFKIIDAKNIDYTYISGKHVIKNVSFKISKGEKVAIVGANGAGKTSLIKLILRLYDVNQGCLSYNGVDYKQYNPKELRSKFATVFQDFQYYAMSIGENVLMRSVENKEDEEKIWNALDLCGLKEKVKNLPDTIYTNISQEFDENGVMFSVGELQKLSIARALVSNAEIVVMDEPSSAMDPISEKEFFDMVFDKLRDKTLIMISHHLSYTDMFDKIMFFDDGQLVEVGKAEQLIEAKGKFASLYNAQCEKFRI